MKFPILPLLATLILLLATIYSHEMAHKLAYEYKGYYNNTIAIDWSDGTFMLRNHDKIAQKDKSDIYQANMMVEAVGYNTLIPLTVIIMLLLIIIQSLKFEDEG